MDRGSLTHEFVPLRACEVHSALFEERFRDACNRGDLLVVEDLLAEFTDVSKMKEFLSKTSSNTGSPLFEAIIRKREEVVALLLDRGSDVEQECSVNIYHPIEFRDKCTALCLACACGYVDIARLLLTRGASVNHGSLHSSPLIYASEYNNVELMQLLLDHGADVHMVPPCLQSEEAHLPLYQACLNGHGDIAELLMGSCRGDLSVDKKLCLLGLLGAQCINKNQDFESGLKYWKEAVSSLEHCYDGELNDGNDGQVTDISVLLQELYLKISRDVTPFASKADSPKKASQAHKLSVFKDIKLCTSITQLEAIESDHSALVLQGLLVLESVLGPSHSATTEQVSHAARNAIENGDIGHAFKLFLFVVESNENRDMTSTATDYSSQLADILLNVNCNFPENLENIPDFADMLLGAIELVASGMHKVFSKFVAGQSKKCEAAFFDTQVKQHSTIRLMTEMVETFMSFLRMLVERPIHRGHWQKLHSLTSELLKLSHQIKNPKFNFECDVLKIAVFGGQSALSVLYFFQEDLFPNAKVLEFLLSCGAHVNCVDIRGDTPLHYSLECSKPDPQVIRILLDNGGHIDMCNRSGVTPYGLLMKAPSLGISPFSYMTLKCHVAQLIARLGLDYQNQVPRMLEEFIPLHCAAKGYVSHEILPLKKGI